MALVVALLGVFGYAAWRELHQGWRLEDLRLALQTEASFHLGRQVRVGALSGDPWTGLTLEDVAISNTRWGFDHGTFAEARRVTVRYRGRAIVQGLTTALYGIDRIEIDGLRTDVARDASGRWNFEELLPKEKEPTGDRFGGTIVLRDASVRFRDALSRTGHGPLDVQPTSLHAEAAFGDPSLIRVRGSCGGGTVPVSHIAFETTIATEAHAGSADVDLVGVDLPYAIQALAIDPRDFAVEQGEANAAVQVAWTDDAPMLYAVRAHVRGGRARVPSVLGRPFEYDGYVSVSPERIVAEGAEVRYGASRGRVTGNLLGLGRPGGLLYEAEIAEAELEPAELLAEWPALPKEWALETPGTLTGDFRVAGSSSEVLVEGTAGLPALTLRGPGGLVSRVGHADLVASLSGVRGDLLDAAVRPVRVEVALPPLFDPPSWLRARDTGLLLGGEVRARMTLSGGKPRVRAMLRNASAQFLGAPVEDLSADLTWEGDRIELPRIEATAAGAGLSGRAVVTLAKDRPRVVAEGSVTGLDLTELGHYADLGDDPLRGRLTARLSYAEGGGWQESPLTIRGRVDGLGWRRLSVAGTVFAAQVRDGVVRVPYFRITDPLGSAQGAFRLLPAQSAGGPALVRDGRVTAEGLDLSPLLAAVRPADAKWPVLRGEAAFAGTVSGPIDAPEVSGKLRVTRPTVDRWQADSLLAQFAWSPREVVLSDLEVRRNAATFSGTGVVRGLGASGGAPAKPEVDLVARVERLSIADAYTLAGQEAPADVTGLLYGELQARGPLGDLEGGGRLTLRDGCAGEWPIREAELTADLVGADLEIHEARVTLDEGRAIAHGTVYDWLGSRFLEADWTLEGLHVDPARQKWAKRYGLAARMTAHGEVRGRIESRATTAGASGGSFDWSAIPLQDYEASGAVSAREVTLGGQPFTIAEAELRATHYANAGLVVIDFGPVRLEGAGGLVRAAGFWESGAQELNLSIDAAGLRFASLASLLQSASNDASSTAAVVRAAEAVGGDLYGSLNVDGKPGGLYVSLKSGRLQGGRYRGRPLPDLSASATWDQLKQLATVRELSLSVGSGVLSGSLTADLREGGRLDGSVAAEEVPLRELAAYFGAEATLRGGTGNLQLLVSGRTDRPTIEGSARASDLDLRLGAEGKPADGRALRTLKLPIARVTGLRVAEGAVEAARIELGSGDPAKDLTVSEVLLPFSWQPLGFRRDERIHARLTLPAQQLAELPLAADVAKRHSVTGKVGATLVASGSLAHPQFQGQVNLEQGGARFEPTSDVTRRLLSHRALEVKNVGLRATITPGQGEELSRVTVSDVRASLLGGQVQGGGSIRLASLSVVDPRNQYDLRLRAAGMSHRFFPGPDGIANLDRATVEFSYDPAIRANKARLRDLAIRVGSGSVSAGGSVVLDPTRPWSELGRNSWDAYCRITNLPLSAKEAARYVVRMFGPGEDSGDVLDVGSGQLSGDLSLTSPPGQPGAPAHLDGKLTLHDASLRVPLALPTGGAAPKWTIGRNDVELNLALHVGRNVSMPQLQAPLAGSATVRGNIHDPVLQGDFRGDGGQIGVLGRTWNLQHLGLHFTYRVDPASRDRVLSANLDIEAETKVSYHGQYVRILLAVHGPLGTTALRLTSDPPLPQEEIIALVGPGGGDGGGGTGETGVDDTLEALQQDLGGALEGLVTTKAIEGLIDQLRKALGLKKLALDIDQGMRVRGFDVEAEISPNLFLRVREGLNTTEKRQEVLIGAGYRLPGRTSVQLEITNLGEVRGTFEGQWRF